MDKFYGFTSDDFNIFNSVDLDNTINAIRSQLQPKFKHMGEIITPKLSSCINKDLYLHIAKHMRRTVNPPKDTWFAIGSSKRGYKGIPHFQFGLFDDHAFIWLAFLYESYNKAEISSILKSNKNLFTPLINDNFLLSINHAKKDNCTLTEETLDNALDNFVELKKSDLLFGKIIKKGDPILETQDNLINFVMDTFIKMSDIYILTDIKN